MLRTRVLGGDGLKELEDSWRELFSASPTATPFQSYPWHRIWWKHYGGARRPRFFAVYEGEDLVGLMPLALGYGFWRTLRPAGIGPSDYLHPLARPEHEESVARLLAEYLSEVRGVDLVDLHQVREARPLARYAPGIALSQAECLVLDLPATFDAYVATLSKSLRYDVKRLDKSPAQVVPVGPDGIDEGMEALFDLHRRRWRGRGLPGAFLGSSLRFHREWAHTASREGFLWLSLLQLEGKPIGAIYAMTAHDVCFYYQAGFDPEQKALSPGTLLVAATIRRAIEEGKRSFDFMRGAEGYKLRWKPQQKWTNHRFVSGRAGPVGEAARAWNLAGDRVETRVRARLEGKGLR